MLDLEVPNPGNFDSLRNGLAEFYKFRIMSGKCQSVWPLAEGPKWPTLEVEGRVHIDRLIVTRGPGN
jgi:hypothetical protein